MNKQQLSVKNNVGQFERDVEKRGSYAYTGDILSARLANERYSRAIAESFNFYGKRVLDLGCGDGTYTFELVKLGTKEVVGIDPASTAIRLARERALRQGLHSKVTFQVGNIYSLESSIGKDRFDCIVLRGVLHHLANPELAVSGLAAFGDSVVILEPNGNNPLLKLIEKFSHYHVVHEEQSFSPRTIRSWVVGAMFELSLCKAFNLIPIFCPGWMAKALRFCSPFVERLPMVRDILCGQIIIVGHKVAVGVK